LCLFLCITTLSFLISYFPKIRYNYMSPVESFELFITFAAILFGGALLFQAEIIPYEPDTGNAVVGNCS